MKRGLMIVGLVWVVAVSAHAYDADEERIASALEDQAAATKRLANAQEMANASAAPVVVRSEPERIEGGGVPQGCELKFLRTPKNESARGKGPDGKRHIVYLLYCPDDE